MPKVFCVPNWETCTGYHEVRYTRKNDLNRARTKRFRNWSKAVQFAKEKAREYGCRPLIHPN